MFTVVMCLLFALIGALFGLIVGYKARDIHEKIAGLYDLWRDRIETPPGVVKISKRRVTRGQQPDTASESGGVMRPRPLKVLDDDINLAANIAQQNRNLR